MGWFEWGWLNQWRDALILWRNPPRIYLVQPRIASISFGMKTYIKQKLKTILPHFYLWIFQRMCSEQLLNSLSATSNIILSFTVTNRLIFEDPSARLSIYFIHPFHSSFISFKRSRTSSLINSSGTFQMLHAFDTVKINIKIKMSEPNKYKRVNSLTTRPPNKMRLMRTRW